MPAADPSMAAMGMGGWGAGGGMAGGGVAGGVDVNQLYAVMVTNFQTIQQARTTGHAIPLPRVPPHPSRPPPRAARPSRSVALRAAALLSRALAAAAPTHFPALRPQYLSGFSTRLATLEARVTALDSGNLAASLGVDAPPLIGIDGSGSVAPIGGASPAGGLLPSMPAVSMPLPPPHIPPQ